MEVVWNWTSFPIQLMWFLQILIMISFKTSTPSTFLNITPHQQSAFFCHSSSQLAPELFTLIDIPTSSQTTIANLSCHFLFGKPTNTVLKSFNCFLVLLAFSIIA
ncbi:hypothetical protein L5515_018153 [Caenorhabditis briggsae]|uniref:Uncharacterized protein n=1 Tax=Caenorhabditis briggsae TaxID=6238 RepID=A0AAE9JS88_CAEBR|nr:hypothetical protein L5515_018153 [Caenorhabditis briggsae]